MKKSSKILYSLASATSLLLLMVSGSAQAANVYLLEENLYAIICEDGVIFSYQGSEEGLSVVVPELCEGHGGVANPGGGIGAAGAAAGVSVAGDVASRRPVQAESASRPAAAATGAIAARQAARSGNDGPFGWCWGERCPAGSVVRPIDRATPTIIQAVTERCGQGSGRVALTQLRQASVHLCPVQFGLVELQAIPPAIQRLAVD